MKKCVNRKNKPAGLVAAVCILLALGMMTGCSAPKAASSEAQAGNSEENVQDTSGSLGDENGGTQESNASTQDYFVYSTPAETDNTQTPGESLSADARSIKGIAEEFAAAYFSGDTDTIRGFLTTPYEWDLEAYTGTDAINDLSVKGLTDIGDEETGAVKVVSLEYKSGEAQDSFQYLTLEFVKQEEGWKIQFYGIE